MPLDAAKNATRQFYGKIFAAARLLALFLTVIDITPPAGLSKPDETGQAITRPSPRIAQRACRARRVAYRLRDAYRTGHCSTTSSSSRLLALAPEKNLLEAWLNLANGDFRLLEVGPGTLSTQIERLRPAEILVPDGSPAIFPDNVAVPRSGASLTGISTATPHHGCDFAFRHARPRRLSCPTGAWMRRAPRCAPQAPSTSTPRQRRTRRWPISPHSPSNARESAWLRLDTATRRNLELTETLRGQPAPTLCSLLDTCVTAMGGRYLRHALHHPLRDPALPAARHAAIEALIENDAAAMRAVRQALRSFGDIERMAGRIALFSARPRDLSGLRDSLQELPALREPLPGLPARCCRNCTPNWRRRMPRSTC